MIGFLVQIRNLRSATPRNAGLIDCSLLPAFEKVFSATSILVNVDGREHVAYSGYLLRKKSTQVD
ncbi:hypothetical protein BJL95_20435 [Methylomonas sp. LWB]|nr:hypothetical protein BJL95_20435 [Methylomonas sp. LWB]